MNVRTIVVEVMQGSQLKTEMRKDGQIFIDRIVDYPFPYCYGYFDNTLAADRDSLDVFIVTNHVILPGTRIAEVKVHGVLLCSDGGVDDHKIVASLPGDRPFLLADRVERIKTFLQRYKTGFVVNGFGDARQAEEIIKACSQ